MSMGNPLAQPRPPEQTRRLHIPLSASAAPIRGASPSVWCEDADLGRVYLSRELTRLLSFPGAPTRRAFRGEVGIFIAKQHRPRFDEAGRLIGLDFVWHSITHNERVDDGAAVQFNRVFGTSGATAAGVLTAVAVASANFTKAKTDRAIGTSTQGATTNEFTGSGLARAAGTLGTYTAPTALGGTAIQRITRVNTATGTVTAYGAALFDSTTPSGSFLYVEDLFATSASLVSGDQLTVNIDITN